MVGVPAPGGGAMAEAGDPLLAGSGEGAPAPGATQKLARSVHAAVGDALRCEWRAPPAAGRRPTSDPQAADDRDLLTITAQPPSPRTQEVRRAYDTLRGGWRRWAFVALRLYWSYFYICVAVLILVATWKTILALVQETVRPGQEKKSAVDAAMRAGLMLGLAVHGAQVWGGMMAAAVCAVADLWHDNEEPDQRPSAQLVMRTMLRTGSGMCRTMLKLRGGVAEYTMTHYALLAVMVVWTIVVPAIIAIVRAVTHKGTGDDAFSFFFLSVVFAQFGLVVLRWAKLWLYDAGEKRENLRLLGEAIVRERANMEGGGESPMGSDPAMRPPQDGDGEAEVILCGAMHRLFSVRRFTDVGGSDPADLAGADGRDVTVYGDDRVHVLREIRDGALVEIKAVDVQDSVEWYRITCDSWTCFKDEGFVRKNAVNAVPAQEASAPQWRATGCCRGFADGLALVASSPGEFANLRRCFAWSPEEVKAACGVLIVTAPLLLIALGHAGAESGAAYGALLPTITWCCVLWCLNWEREDGSWRLHSLCGMCGVEVTDAQRHTFGLVILIIGYCAFYFLCILSAAASGLWRMLLWFLVLAICSQGMMRRRSAEGMSYKWRKTHNLNTASTYIFGIFIFVVLFMVVIMGGDINAGNIEESKSVELDQRQGPSGAFYANGAYPMCTQTWLPPPQEPGNAQLKRGCFSLVDLAFLSNVAYDGWNNTQDDTPALDTDLRMWFGQESGADRALKVVHQRSSGRGVHFFDIECELCNASIIAVRGTSSGLDALEDGEIWGEAVMVQVLSKILPLSPYSWPEALLGAFINVADAMSLRSLTGSDGGTFYKDLQDYVQLRKRGTPARQLLLTGHSLGGGLANLVGALENVPSVAFSPPGVEYSRVKYGALLQSVNQHNIAVVPYTDLVPMIDKQGGNVQGIACNADYALPCHTLARTTCTLIEHCGDQLAPAWAAHGLNGWTEANCTGTAGVECVDPTNTAASVHLSRCIGSSSYTCSIARPTGAVTTCKPPAAAP